MIAVIEIELPICRRVIRRVRPAGQIGYGPRHGSLEDADVSEVVVVAGAALAISPAGAKGEPPSRLPVGVDLCAAFGRGAGVEPREIEALVVVGGADIDRIDRPPGHSAAPAGAPQTHMPLG